MLWYMEDAGMLVDTHAHLDFEAFDHDRPQVLQRAREAGLGAVITIALTPDHLPGTLALVEGYRGLYATVGIHPHEAASWLSRLDEALRLVEDALAHPGVVAVGEVGLDFFRNRSPRQAQEDVFRAMARLAVRSGRPLVIHSRKAGEQVLAVLDEEVAGQVEVVMHCFSGDEDFARRCVQRGFHLGFGGVTTFPNAPEVRRAAAAIPIDRLLLETDCPYLAPQPRRGKRNEPAYVKWVAEAIGAARGVAPGEVVRHSTENACRLFGIDGVQDLGRPRTGTGSPREDASPGHG